MQVRQKDRKPSQNHDARYRFSPPWSEPARIIGLAEVHRARRRAQPAAIRLAHWINIPLLVIMAGSGLQILAAYPALGPRGGLYRWYPFQNDAPHRGCALRLARRRASLAFSRSLVSHLQWRQSTSST